MRGMNRRQPDDLSESLRRINDKAIERGETILDVNQGALLSREGMQLLKAVTDKPLNGPLTSRSLPVGLEHAMRSHDGNR